MKKLLVVALLFLLTVGSIAAFNQTAYVGFESNVYDLFDVRDQENLDVSLIPYANYLYGDWASPGLYGHMQLGAPYEIGADFNTLFPELYSELYYRIGIPNYDSIINVGLETRFFKNTFYDTTIMDNTLRAYWYPFDKATETWTADPYYPYYDGFRIGFGLDAGAELSNLLEDADIRTRAHGALVGRIVGGAELYDRIWMQVNLVAQLPNVSYWVDSEEMSLAASGYGSISLSYVGDRFMLHGGLSPELYLNNLYLADEGFLSGASYDYRFWVFGDAEIEFVDNLRLYVGGQVGFSRGDNNSASAHVGVTYFIL